VAKSGSPVNHLFQSVVASNEATPSKAIQDHQFKRRPRGDLALRLGHRPDPIRIRFGQLELHAPVL
jgi:hypothetical protein